MKNLLVKVDGWGRLRRPGRGMTCMHCLRRPGRYMSRLLKSQTRKGNHRNPQYRECHLK